MKNNKLIACIKVTRETYYRDLHENLMNLGYEDRLNLLKYLNNNSNYYLFLSYNDIVVTLNLLCYSDLDTDRCQIYDINDYDKFLEIARELINDGLSPLICRPLTIIKIRDGRLCVGIVESKNLEEMTFYSLPNLSTRVVSLKEYDMDLRLNVPSDEFRCYDIMEVYHVSTLSDAMASSYENLQRDLIWRRDEKPIKLELILEEIARKFGVNVNNL